MHAMLVTLFIAMFDNKPKWINEIKDNKVKNVSCAKNRMLNIALVQKKLKKRLSKAYADQVKD